MSEPVTIVVLEPQPRWVPELQRQFAQEPFTVRASRTSADFRTRLQATRTAGVPVIAVIDLAAGLSTGLTLAHWLNDQDVVGTIVVGNADAVTLEPLLRELGAMSVHAESVSGTRLASECRRFVAAAQCSHHAPPR